MDERITEAVISARRADRSWSEIGLMLGFQSKLLNASTHPRYLVVGPDQV